MSRPVGTRARRRSAGRPPRSVRAACATLVWWSGVVVASLVAVAVLGRALRADAADLPWRWLFAVADALSPGFMAEVLGREVGLTAVRLDMAAWSATSGAVLGATFLLALVLRPDARAGSVTDRRG